MWKSKLELSVSCLYGAKGVGERGVEGSTWIEGPGEWEAMQENGGGR